MSRKRAVAALQVRRSDGGKVSVRSNDRSPFLKLTAAQRVGTIGARKILAHDSGGAPPGQVPWAGGAVIIMVGAAVVKRVVGGLDVGVVVVVITVVGFLVLGLTVVVLTTVVVPFVLAFLVPFFVVVAVNCSIP